jgi:hypothetical protein
MPQKSCRGLRLTSMPRSWAVLLPNRPIHRGRNKLSAAHGCSTEMLTELKRRKQNRLHFCRARESQKSEFCQSLDFGASKGVKGTALLLLVFFKT